MARFSDNESLNREHNFYGGVVVAAHLFFLAIFMLCLIYALDYEDGSGWSVNFLIKLVISIAVFSYYYHSAHNSTGIFYALGLWEQSLNRRHSDFELIQAFNSGHRIFKDGREVEVFDGHIVPKPGNADIPKNENKIKKDDFHTAPLRDTLHAPEDYIKVIRSMQSLTPEQEQELTKRMVQGDKIARDRMIEANLRLVVALGRKYADCGIRFSDIVEAGNMGLIRAIERYKPERGFKSTTYAAWWVNKAIVNAIAAQTGTTAMPITPTENETFDYVLNADLFVEHICIACGFKGEYFLLPYRFYACPKCLNERVNALRQIEHVVPDWILHLEEDSVFRSKQQQLVRNGDILFIDCEICKRAVLPDNIRYYYPQGVYKGKPCCIECYGRILDET